MNVKGRAAHSSVPQTGTNAIQAMARLLLALDEHSKSLSELRHELVGSPTLTVGRIDGGTQVNIVAENCWAEFDRRLIPGENPAEVMSFYEDFLRKQPTLSGSLSLSLEPLLQDWPLDTSLDTDVVRKARCVLRDIGLDDRPVGVPFGSDASKLRRVGIPSVIFGPGSINLAHAAEEYVRVDEVHQALIFYSELIRRFS
jgi:acetylornithine deacetylase